MTDIQIKPEELLELAQKIGQAIQMAQEGQPIINEASSYATTTAIEDAKIKLLKQLETYLETLDHGHQKVFIAREAMIAADENYAATYNVDLWGMPKSIEKNPIAVTEWKRKNIYMENGVLVNPMGHKVIDTQTRAITEEDLRSSHNFGVYHVYENGQIYFVQGKRFVDKIPELEPEGNARPTDLLEGTGYEWVEYMGGPVFFGKKLAKNAIKKLEDEIGDIGRVVPKGAGKSAKNTTKKIPNQFVRKADDVAGTINRISGKFILNDKTISNLIKDSTSYKKLAQHNSAEDLVKNLEFNGWKKIIDAPRSKKSGEATKFINPENGDIIRIMPNPANGKPYFKVQNTGGGWLDEFGNFPSNANKKELRDLTHFYFGK